MSYYSDVGIALRIDDYERLKEAFAERAGQDDAFSFQEVESFADDFFDLDDYVVLVWHSVKWYGEMPERLFIEHFLKQLDEYQFLRVGEDSKDVEYENKAKGWDLLYPITKTEIGIAYS